MKSSRRSTLSRDVEDIPAVCFLGTGSALRLKTLYDTMDYITTQWEKITILFPGLISHKHVDRGFFPQAFSGTKYVLLDCSGAIYLGSRGRTEGTS